MHIFTKVILSLSLLLTAGSGLLVAGFLAMKQVRINQMTGDSSTTIWLVIGYMILLFVQCMATLFSKEYSITKKTIRSLVLAIAFSLPWFYIYQGQL